METEKQQVHAVNLHHSILFQARERHAVVEDEKEVEEARRPQTLSDMIEALVAEGGEGSGDERDRPRELTLDSGLELRTEPPPLPTTRLWRKDPLENMADRLLPGMAPPPPKLIRQYDMSPDDYSSESDEPVRKSWKIPTRLRHPDVNMYSKDYWLARKKVKTLRVGNDLAVNNTLILMAKMDLSQQDIIYGIVDPGGMETLLNILDYKGVTPKLNALKLLNMMADNEIVKGLMVNQGIADSCFQLLAHTYSEIVLEASRILLKLCALNAMRAYCRKSKSLEVLLEFAEMEDSWLYSRKPPQLSGRSKDLYEVSVNCLEALDLLFHSRAVRKELYKLGFLRLLKRLTASANPHFFQMGIRMTRRSATVLEFAEMEDSWLYSRKPPQLSGRSKDLYEVSVNCLEALDLLFHSRAVRKELYKLGFLRLLKRLTASANPHFFQMGIRMTRRSATVIRDYAGYLLGQLSRYPKNFPEIAGPQNIGVMKLLEYVQTNTDYTLVAHIYKVICDLSFDDRIYWDICDVTDPIRILWGAVTADHPQINEYGCSALVPYIGPMPDSVERVSEFPGALHDLLRLTEHPDDGAKAGAVTLLARLCQMDTLYEPILEEGFDRRLLDLAQTATHPRLRYAIGYGFGSCSRTSRMSFSLGKRGAVAILLDWLVNDKDKYAQLGIVTGLWKMSYEPINCKAIIQAKVAERLTYLSVGKNECLQNSLAGLLGNMRYLARAAESLRNRQQAHPAEPGRGLASDPDIIHPFQYADDPDDTPV